MTTVPPPPTLKTPYPIWVFVLGPVSGPQRMIVRPQKETDGFVGIKADQKVFSYNDNIAPVVLTINDKLFCVYFNQTLHSTTRANATYVFMHLHSCDVAIDITIEDDLTDIIDCLTR